MSGQDPAPAPLIAEFLAAFAAAGQAPALYSHDGQSVSHVRLLAHVRRLAVRLREAGIGPGDRVAPVVPNTTARLMLIFALWSLGAEVALTEDPERLTSRGIALDCAVRGDVQPPPSLARDLVMTQDWFGGPEAPPFDPVPGARVLASTSGGRARYFTSSVDPAIRRGLIRSELWRDETGPHLQLFNLTTTGGLVFALPSLLAGGALVLPAPRLVDSLAHAHLTGATALSAAPRDLEQIATLVGTGAAPRPPFLSISTGGGALAQTTIDRLRALWPEVRITIFGGSNEAFTVSCGTLPEGEVPFGWAGYVLPEAEVALREVGQWEALAPGAGLLAVRLPPEVQISPYIGGESPYDADGWTLTGDVVSLGVDGALRFLGRRDFVINLGGNKVAPEVIEAQATIVLGVSGVVAVPVRQDGVDALGLTLTTTPEFDRRALFADLAPRLGHGARLYLAEMDVIPRLPGGKPDRQAILRDLAAREPLTLPA